MAAGSNAGPVTRPPGKVGVAIALVAVFLLVRALRPDAKEAPSTAAPQQTAAALPAAASPPPAEKTPPAEPSLQTVVGTAAGDAQRSVEALGSSGARLYSENCYAALASRSSDGVRDRCFAFDRIAGRLLDQAGDQAEAFWFSEQSAVDRYRQSFGSGDTDVDARMVHVNAAIQALGPTTAPTVSSAESAKPMDGFETITNDGGEAPQADEPQANGMDREVTAPSEAEGADPAS
jgi:hypothetical protein